MRSNRCSAAAIQRCEESTLHIGRRFTLLVIHLVKRFGRIFRQIIARHDADNTLRGSGQHVFQRNGMCHMRHAESCEARHGQIGCIRQPLFQLSHTGRDIAPEGDDLKIRSARQRLRFAPQRCGTDFRAFRQLCQRSIFRRQEALTRILAFRKSDKALPLWQH